MIRKTGELTERQALAEFGELKSELNRFDRLLANDGYLLTCSNYEETPIGIGSISNYINVRPGDTITVNQFLGSSLYGHVFYDKNYIPLSSVLSTDANLQFTAPTNARYIRFSLLAAKKDTFCATIRTYQMDANEAAFNGLFKSERYGRVSLKNPSTPRMGYRHNAFPCACIYNKQTYIVSRLGATHLTPTNPDHWGGIIFDIRDEFGNWTHSKIFKKSDFTGLDGEIRDTCIQPTRDGEYLVLSAVTTYYDNIENDVHDNLLAILDANLNVISYKVFKAVEYLFYGNALCTPEGRIVVGGWDYQGIAGVYTTSVISDYTNISGISIDFTAVYTNTTTHPTESCVGYYRDKIVLMIRCEDANTKISISDNLEGNSGWSEAVDTGRKINAPKLLPYCNQDYLVFVGAWLKYWHSEQDRLRVASIGYLDIETGRIVALAEIDETQTGYSGYTGFVYFGGDEYGTVYYQEGGNTGLYYRNVNTRQLMPELSYLM